MESTWDLALIETDLDFREEMYVIRWQNREKLWAGKTEMLSIFSEGRNGYRRGVSTAHQGRKLQGRFRRRNLSGSCNRANRVDWDQIMGRWKLS